MRPFDLFVADEAAPAKSDGSSAKKRFSPRLSEYDTVRRLQETDR